MGTITHKKRLACWMILNGFATGHGDTFEDLLKELTWQVQELRDNVKTPHTTQEIQETDPTRQQGATDTTKALQ